MQMSLHPVSPVARLKAAWGAQALGPYRDGDVIRDLDGLPPLLERSGPFEIRLATTKREIRKIQKLRFKVFFEEGGATADLRTATTRRDICPFDRICDHLFILDTEATGKSGRRKARVVGSYRLLRGTVAARHGGFYSRSEFEIAPLLARHADKQFLELGRSCVHKDYRTKRVIELLWRGLWIYAAHHDVDALIGCASLPGVDPSRHAAALSFLHHHAAAEGPWHVSPNRGRGVSMDLMGKDAVSPRAAAAGLPPLIKAYMRVGARFGDGAVIDHRFGTTDVFTIMPMDDVALRYRAHFGGVQA